MSSLGEVFLYSPGEVFLSSPGDVFLSSNGEVFLSSHGEVGGRALESHGRRRLPPPPPLPWSAPRLAEDPVLDPEGRPTPAKAKNIGYSF